MRAAPTAIQTEIIEKYSKGKSCLDLSNEYNIFPSTVCRILERHGIKRRKNTISNRIYNINENFFDFIDREEKAYMLGFLYADGCNYTKKNLVQISLAEEDKQILMKFNELLETTKPLRSITYKTNPGFKNRQNAWVLSVENAHVSKILNDYGMIPNKSLTVKYPTFLSDDMQRHFIRGYFDGDGCIYTNKGTYEVSILGTENMCNTIKQIIFKDTGIVTHVKKYKNIFRLRISGRKNVINIGNYFYDNSSIYLNRKKEKFERIEGYT